MTKIHYAYCSLYNHQPNKGALSSQQAAPLVKAWALVGFSCGHHHSRGTLASTSWNWNDNRNGALTVGYFQFTGKEKRGQGEQGKS